MRQMLAGLTLMALLMTPSPGEAMELRSIDGQATIFVSCAEGGRANVAIVQRPGRAFRPYPQMPPAGPNPKVTYSIDSAGPFSAEWERRDDGAVVAPDSRQAKAFLIELLGREFLFVSVNRPPSFEFHLGGFSGRLAELVSACR